MANSPQEDLIKKDLYKPEAEKLVIAGLVSNGELYPTVKKIITSASMFYDLFNQEVYRTIENLDTNNEVIDFVTILSANPNIPSGKLSDTVTNVSLPQGLAISTDYLTGKNIDTYAKIVAKAYLKREVYKKVSHGEDVSAILETVNQLEKQGLDKFFNPTELALQVLADLKTTKEGLRYPFHGIQVATNGIHKGQVIVVAARPSTGKSTFLENVATYIGQQGKKVLFASAEMETPSIGLRMLSRLIRKNLFYDRDKLTPEEQKRVEKQTEILAGLNLYIHELYSTDQLEAVIKEKARDFDLVVVDYLQLLEPRVRARSPYERVTAVANELTQMAKKYHLPFIVAAQYNRMAEKNQPTMADLKESGQIEQNADVIISLWSKDEDKISLEKQKVRYDILKNRNGFTVGNFKDQPDYFLWFNKKFFEFRDDDSNEVLEPETFKPKQEGFDLNDNEPF